MTGLISCFADISFVDEVPFDPDLTYCFAGEEPDLGIRAWMKGYDFFGPDVQVQFHHYNRFEHPCSYQDKDIPFNNDLAISKVCKLLDVSTNLIIPGTDTSDMIQLPTPDDTPPEYYRSLQDYWDFTGFNPNEPQTEPIFLNEPPVVTNGFFRMMRSLIISTDEPQLSDEKINLRDSIKLPDLSKSNILNKRGPIILKLN